MKLKKDANSTLRVVKTAGFKLDKKAKNVNGRAGLSKTKKTKDGESVVKRSKPLSLGRVRRMRKAALALSCVVVGIISYIAVGFFTKAPVEELSDVSYSTVCVQAPSSGTPADYTLIENVAYMNYVLQNQPYWSSEMHSTVNTVMQQKVHTYKQYYNGVLISADVAEGVSSEATQFCITDDIVLWRSAASKKFDGMNTPWSTKEPEGLTVEKFKRLRGLPPSEFSVYVLNENTVKNAGDYSVIDNGDGTYTMTLELNVGVQDAQSAADYYYKQQMYVTGGLDERPEISWTQLSYTFDSSWRILEFTINDAYTAKMGIKVGCTSTTTTVFSYDEEKAKNSFYDDYFKNYVDNFTEADVGENNAPNALNYLAAAFGNVLSEGATFKVNLGLDKLDMDGVVHVGIEEGALADIRVALGDISVFMGTDKILYVSDGNAKYKLDTAVFASMATADEEEGSALDIGELTNQLAAGTFEVSESGATLDSALEILGLKVKLHFDFEISDNAVALGYVSAEIPVGNTLLKARLEYGTKDDIPAKPQDITGYTDILNEGITLKTNFIADGLNLDGYVKIIMSKGAFAGVYANLGNIAVLYDCPTDMLCLTDGNVKYKLSLGGLSADSFDLSGATPDIGALLAQIISNLRAENGVISTTATLDILEQTISAALAIRLAGGIEIGASVSALEHDFKLNVALSSEQVTLPDTTEYVDVLNEGIAISAELTVDGFELDGLVYVGLSEGKFTELRADFGKIAAYYVDGNLYITDGNVKYKVALPQTETTALDIPSLDIKEIIRNIVFADDAITATLNTQIFGETLSASLEIGLNGGISVKLDAGIFGKSITLNARPTTQKAELPDLSEYTDILNEGIAFDLGLTIDETGGYDDGAIELNGRVFIGLKAGELTEVRADFGKIAVYFETEGQLLYVKVGTTKLKINVGEIESGSNPDVASLLPDGTPSMIAELLNNLIAELNEISIRTEIGFMDALVPVSAKLNIADGIKAEIAAELCGIGVTLAVSPTRLTVPALGEDSENYVDIINELWGAIESVIGNTLSVGVSGSLYSYDNSKYAQYGFVKYNFNALLEYDYDGDGVAVNLNTGKVNENGVREGVSFNVDSEVYLHFNLELLATSPLDSSLCLDILVLDADPKASDKGVTGGGYTKDGVLDVYVSVSTYASYSPSYQPLKVYAPMDEILTLLAMVGSAGNLDKLEFKNGESLNAAVKEIASVIDCLLVEKYIPNTKDQFASLGASLIPQILGTSLSEYLDNLLSSLGSTDGETGLGNESGEENENGESGEKNENGEGSESANTKFDISAKYINRISLGNDSLTIKLNSSLIYGAEIAEDDYIVVEFNRADFDGTARLTDVSLKNVYFGKDNVNELDIALKLGYGEVSRPDKESGLNGYINFDGVDTLLKALVNSATHATSGENEYELNDYYLLNGSVNATISVIGINIGVDIILNSIAVYIDEDNNVSVDAHISYQGVQELNQVAINGDTDLYLSIKNDMIYLKRVQKTYWEKTFIITTEKTYATPVVEYRVMPLSAFLGDIMNQIIFMFNFGSLVSDNLANAGSGGSGASFDGRDLGNLVNYVLAYYTCTESDGEVNWNFAINGGMLTDLVGMTMSDIPITFTAEKNGDGTLTVKGLSVRESTMQLAGSAVTLKFSAGINYCNPHQIADHGYTDSSIKLDEAPINELNGLSFNSILGGNSFKDICSVINWSLLTADTGVNYLSYSSGCALGVAPLKYLYATDGDNSQFAQWGDTYNALYNGKTNNIYTYSVAPALSSLMPKIENKTAVWKSDFEVEGGTLVLKAIYDTTYKVVVDSAHPVDDDYEYDEERGVWNNTVDEAYGKLLLPVNVYYTDGDNVTYGLKHYVDESGNVCSFDKTVYNGYGELCFVASVNSEAHYTAVWERVYEVKFIAETDDKVYEIGKFYYAGERVSDNLPEVPNVGGYSGEWIIPENATVTEGISYTFYAKYTIRSYTIKLVSAQAVTDGAFVAADGGYASESSHLYASKVTLQDLVSASGAYIFRGFYSTPDYSGAPVTQFLATCDATYYAKWEGKILNVTYKSDLPFGSAKLGDDNFYSFAVRMQYGVSDNLASYSSDGKIFLGWYYKSGEAYSFISSAEQLKSKFESVISSSESADIILWAAWAVDGVEINLTKVSGVQWAYTGTYSVIFADGISATIAASAGVKCTVSVTYYAHGNKLFGGAFSYDKLGTATFEGASGSLNKSGMNCGNGVGGKNLKGSVKVSAAFSCEGVEFGSTSEYEQFCNKT